MHSVENPLKLTAYSHGAGCGCKISPQILDKIIHTDDKRIWDQLLVGNESKDDAAAFDWGNGEAVISTTDFFMPIVDDPFHFGKIAATNAISDVYAMGGTPQMAIAILGWPIDKLPPEVAREVINGGRTACHEAGIPLAGGHSIDSPEPIFGLAVTGKVKKEHIKQNNTANANCTLYLTKPLGIGIITTAQKRNIVQTDDLNRAILQMEELNKIGAVLGALPYVKALTDVTGFGLFGHLIELADGSGVSAFIQPDAIPILQNIPHYLAQECFPGGTKRNLASYQHRIDGLTDQQLTYIGADPQTSGGLLIAVENQKTAEFEKVMEVNQQAFWKIGQTGNQQEKAIYFK